MAALESLNLELIIGLGTGINSAFIIVLAYRAGQYSRQIDVNSGRLDTLESRGSPAVSRIESKVQDLAAMIMAMELDIKEIRSLFISHLGDRSS